MGNQTEVCVEIQRKVRSRDIERAIGALAERQYGVVSRQQLMELGLGRGAIDHRLRLGRLLPLYRGSYAVGQRRLPREARWMAAVLAVGPGTVLSHRPAGAHWQIVRWSGVPEVTTPRKVSSRRGIRVHVADLPKDEITTLHGIPVTTVPRTLLDMAADLPERQLERALNETEVRRLWDELSLNHLLDRYPGRSGTRAIKAVLRKRNQGATLTRSELEDRFIELVDAGGLPRPQVDVLVEGFLADAVWRRERVVVELDGRRTHDTVESFESDRERDRILSVAGWRPIRITGRQLVADRASLVADLRRLLAVTV
jgi:Protein of unknown function (DUF559)/Transcriptional regulator, AbiEi antitoxin